MHHESNSRIVEFDFEDAGTLGLIERVSEAKWLDSKTSRTTYPFPWTTSVIGVSKVVHEVRRMKLDEIHSVACGEVSECKVAAQRVTRWSDLPSLPLAWLMQRAP
jgi:hypothetical protein